MALVSMCLAALAQAPALPLKSPSKPTPQSLPPRVAEAERFLAQRGVKPGQRFTRRPSARATLHPPAQANSATPLSGASSVPTWTALGPSAVQTPSFGLVTGRISALALDPSDPTGNRLYVGTTGGGVWEAADANASPSAVTFSPLTDSLSTLGGAQDATISIGALSVQPGGTGVILAGTGDPNDLLDSYYGAGILRSTDAGTTWSLIPATTDEEDGLGLQDYGFTGEGFAGFAWSSTNPQRVVAALSQAYEATLVDAVRTGYSYQGLYYSSDSGASWHLATITDGSGFDVQGPLDPFATPDGNAATAVVWNQQRGLFIAAVRYHGFYQSIDGITWTRMAPQPGTGLSTRLCPTYQGSKGSIACPNFRGALAVNPITGDTFAWYVDANDQDQGLWQDVCSWNGTACSHQTVTFAQQWNTAALEASGTTTIPDGKYNLALAAVPSQQETLVFAGANDLWKSSCPLSQGCTWRNTTNSTTCMSAKVGEYQHALAWNAANPLEMFIGNDSGLWRSTDAVGETGAACNPADSTHFQNLNGEFQNTDGTPGSLGEVESLSPVTTTPYAMMAGLGVIGAAGVKATTVTADWPQILSGYGGPVAIDPRDSSNWYVNDQAGVAIYRCSQSAPCTAADFGSSPVVTDADVSGDGDSMPTPAPFLVDPVDSTQLLIGTCRIWRGPANGSGWSKINNAISYILDNDATGACNGDGLVRSMDAMALAGGSEIVYIGMYGSATFGAILPGHVLSATFNPSSSVMPQWNDLTPIPTGSNTMNPYNLDISSVFIDPHDPSGQTVYLTVEGVSEPRENVSEVYRSTNGGASWSDITANLPESPANSLVVDPQNANTVYVATDQGVWFTTEAENCAQSLSNCWSVFGTGLPEAPVVALSAAPVTASAQVLVAGTYGRGIWQTPLFTAGTSITAAAVSPATLSFPSQVFQTQSSSLTISLENTGSLPLLPTSISPSGDFNDTNNCARQTIAVGTSCTINVTFTPSATGPRTGQLTIFANVYGGQITVDLNGAGAPAGAVTLSTTTLDLGNTELGVPSATQPVGVTNKSATAVPIASVGITPPFSIAGNSTCGTVSLAADNTCQISVAFTPTAAGVVTGLLTLTDGAGTQVVQLSGNGEAVPTDILNPTTLVLPSTGVGQISTVTSQTQVTITNMGDLPLTNITAAASAQFEAVSKFGSQIAGHSAGVISVQFAPTQTGNQTGTLTITDFTNQPHTQTVALSGTGLLPAAFTISPAFLIFATSQAGVPSAPQTVKVTNSGGAPMADVQIQITGAAFASYSLSNNTCNGVVLNSGSSCTVGVTFTPAATGPIAAMLAASSSTVGVTAGSIQLNGAGQLATALSVSPTLVTFTTATGVAQPSAPQTVTVVNSSQYAIASVTLAATGPFSVNQGACAGGLAAGATCTASVIFQPTVFGPVTGTLTVSSPVVTTPASATLAGTGFDFTLGAPTPLSMTVTSGQQADYTLAITPEAAPASFTFACGTLPTNALCLFNPATQTLGSGVQGNVMVQIYTGSSAVKARTEPPAHLGGWPLLCGLFLLPLALARRRKALLLVALAAILTCSVTSCTSSGGGTGGSGGQDGGSGTPAGTYQIPVTVTAMGISHAQTVTLTVD